jgi:hypothetical protein
MPFQKKTWILTIEQMKCKKKRSFLNKNFIALDIDCRMGESGPRSLLILNYKGQYTSVHA